jgi:hypothetical protein
MPVDYSQKRLISAGFRARGNSKHAKRLRLYAFLTGLMSTLISLATLYVNIMRG